MNVLLIFLFSPDGVVGTVREALADLLRLEEAIIGLRICSESLRFIPDTIESVGSDSNCCIDVRLVADTASLVVETGGGNLIKMV